MRLLVVPCRTARPSGPRSGPARPEEFAVNRLDRVPLKSDVGDPLRRSASGAVSRDAERAMGFTDRSVAPPTLGLALNAAFRIRVWVFEAGRLDYNPRDRRRLGLPGRHPD